MFSGYLLGRRHAHSFAIWVEKQRWPRWLLLQVQTHLLVLPALIDFYSSPLFGFSMSCICSCDLFESPLWGLIQHRDRRHHKTSLYPTPAGPSFPRAPSNFHFIIKPENSGKLVTYPRFRFMHAKPFAHARDLQDSSLGSTQIQSYIESLRQSTAEQVIYSPNGPNWMYRSPISGPKQVIFAKSLSPSWNMSSTPTLHFCLFSFPLSIAKITRN